jgi:hypothetical protein
MIGFRLFDREASAMAVEQVGYGFDELTGDPDTKL